MIDFTLKSQENARVNQQRILPTAIKPAGTAQLSLVNTQATINGPYSLGNGGNLTFTSFIQNNANPLFRLGGVPYNIVFFEDVLDTDNIIGDTITGYKINGPLSMPTFNPAAININGVITLGGSDGNNLVYLTELINNTGITHNIYVITDTRVYNPIGGGGGQA